MTEYGRGSGSQPWNPGDPQHGDPGYEGRQHPPQQQPYPGQQQYPDQRFPEQQQYGWEQSAQGGGGHYGDPHSPSGQQYGQPGQSGGGYYGSGGGYPGQDGQSYDTGQHPHVQQQAYDTGQHPQPGGQQAYDTGQHPQQSYDTGQHPHPAYDTGQHPQQAYDTGQHPQQSYDTGQHPHPSYDTGQHPQQAYDTGQHPRPGEGRVPQQATAKEPHEEWLEESSGGHSLLSKSAAAPAPRSSPAIDLLPGGVTDEDDETDAAEEPRRGRRGGGSGGKGKKQPKRRSGTACLVVAVVLVGAVGGLGYLGYDYWETNYGPAPDYEGEGTGSVQVEIPKGAGLTQMGDLLQKNGVVKSARAFTEAAGTKLIQPGTYTLHKEMSAESAVTMMTDTKNLLTIREGIRAAEVYSSIDKKLELKPGTTKDVAKAQARNLGLPDWATADPDVKDPLEGFLFPSQYNAGKGTKPEEILRQMVKRAKANYEQQDLEGKAKELGLKSPLQVITVASLVQVEGKYKHDFDKIARVVYNRLKPDNKETYGLLDFDSTVNYAKSQSTLDTGSVNDLRKFKDPYNTYSIKGLPPGPISNPGMDALKSALEPASGPWYYFVSINENETLFAVTNAEHNKNRQRYEQEHRKAAGQ
ncbi:endolytic transglycosylase MltG [Streptomyces mobaraensis NBRC 13819 = DSM 40847]|uniref:endolytic transglycosylase MltG n=1 Tax=Streptomyces mobaraensis TaxID=35621 RepID=UPI00059464B7|nr:endolytic transglycosylase MltG [Streptomyces mobaraensis]QTT72876.1 endolytic transglycosylase MltG [Streptomyces mobaraensis NBRC 13819 = DSM 40847]